jgi:CheY-like chemotaxis protein
MATRLRILWADDQKQTAEALSQKLRDLDARVKFCTDGSSALDELSRGYFDLLILDLSMPPDRWGGLFVLEQLASRALRIPVLVLSGEGTQTETIKALRLGAHDYVTKDRADEELRGTVEKTIKEYWSPICKSGDLFLPAPIAVPLAAYLSEESDSSRLRRITEYFESVVRFSAVILASSAERKPMLKELLGLGSPSFGTWDELRRRLQGMNVPLQPSEKGISYALEDGMMIEQIVGVRNDLVHGREPSFAACEGYLKKFIPALEQSVKVLSQRLVGQLVHVSWLGHDGVDFEIIGREISGKDPAFRAFKGIYPSRLVTKRTYWRDGDEYRNVEPLLLTQATGNTWQVLIFDGFKGDRSSIRGDEDLQYVEILSRRRQEPANRYFTKDLGFPQ